jgi:phosphate-selective porin OprO/OprP
MPRSVLILSAMLAALCWQPAARGQDVAAELANLKSRIESLERENQDLKTAVGQRLPPLEVDASDPRYTSTVPLTSTAPQSTYSSDELRVQSIVEKYLAEHGTQMTATAAAPDGGPAKEPEFAEVGQDLSMTARWNNGLELATKDKAFRVHIGGRWQMDTSVLSAEPQVNANLPGGGTATYRDGIDFRRARLRIDGRMYEQIDFAMEYDFVNGLRERIDGVAANDVHINVTAITDLWLQFTDTPLGHLRIGNQKEAIGFEHIVSSRFLPFMERSYNQDTFYGGTFNGFTPGASLSHNYLDDRASWNIGIYKPTNNVFAFSTNDDDYAVTGRLTYLPLYEFEGRQLVHLGISGRHATTYDELIRYRTRDAIRAGVSTQWPVPADITVFGDTVQWINAEFAAVNGPWTLQAEWLVNFLSDAQRFAGGAAVGPNVDCLTYHGGYVQLLYFLTGESDTYSLERMAFDRMKPFENAFWVPTDWGSCFARGAWQVGARYNYLDLDDQGINGGKLHNLTLGLNWFFNPNTKWQLNYMATHRDVADTVAFPNGSGWIHGVGMRFAQDF